MNILLIVKKLQKMKLSFQCLNKLRQIYNYFVSSFSMSESSVFCQKKSDIVSKSFQKLFQESFNKSSQSKQSSSLIQKLTKNQKQKFQRKKQSMKILSHIYFSFQNIMNTSSVS